MSSERKIPHNPDEAKIRRAVDACLQDENGRELITWLFDTCEYNTSGVVVDQRTLEIRATSTLYNAARRSVYVKLRSLATGKLLAPVEEAAEARARAVLAEKSGPEKET